MNYITISQAEENWHIKSDRIMRYVAEGVIANLKVENNILLLPDVNPPHYIARREFDAYKEIIRATVNKEYIDSLLIHDSQENFAAMVVYLIQNEYLLNVNNNDGFSSNIGLVDAPKGKDWFSHPWRKLYKSNNLNVNIQPNFTVNNQIGLVNIGG